MIECVPNFSEGRDVQVVNALARSLTVPPLDVTADADHNRCVLTFAGSPEQARLSAFRAVETASRLIDISRHEGVHPRTGAADVVPFVPLGDTPMAVCAETARALGEEVWTQLRIPVFFYERAALCSAHERLEHIRRNVLVLSPDIGDVPHPTAGVCIIGARKFLVAWNINLDSEDLPAARQIAAAIRESSGGFRAVKSLGLALPARRQVQVSINLVDFEVAPLWVVFRRVEELCAAKGIRIAGSELIGLIPQAALDASAGHDLRWLNLTSAKVIEKAIRKLQ